MTHRVFPENDAIDDGCGSAKPLRVGPVGCDLVVRC
jgi:hypothetical protein